VKVAVAQVTSGPDVGRNLEVVERLVRAAAADGARLVVLPECFAYLGPEEGKLAVAEVLPAPFGPATAPGPLLARCAEVARTAGVELVLGGFWETGTTADRVRNACLLIGADGALRAAYRKLHLFDVELPDGTTLRESATVEPGTEVVAVDSVCGRLGLTVCYDLRFPELFRALVDRGATVMAVPSAFTLTTGKDHWHVLLRARAIESQAYVLAAAQFGRHFGSRVSYGHALIADPWGVVLAECPDGEGFACAWVDGETVARVRASLPSLRHRRAELR
jgi:predicted amidohydrolase